MPSSWLKSERRTFGFRMHVWFALVLIALTAALFVAAYWFLFRAVQERDREVVRAQFYVYRTWYQEGGLPELMRQFSELHDSGRELFFVRVVGPQRTGLFVSFPPRFEDFDLGELEQMTPKEALAWLTVPSRSHSGWWLVATERLQDGDWLQVGKTMDAQGALFAQFRDVSLWVMFAALALGIGGGAWLTRRTLSPIRKLIGSVRQVIATGHMDERMPEPEVHDELGELTRLFNVMLEKNGVLINGMREALDNVAHDLRTPLTRFRSTAEVALEGPEDIAVYRDALLDSMEESERLLTMLNTLMDISEAETGLMRLDRQRFPLAPLVAEIVELFELVAEDKGITQTTEVPVELVCFADRNRLRQVLANLLDNALKYTPSGGKVKISAHPEVDGVAIVCQDSGIGIFAEDVAKIWDRLYRADKSRSQRGLGLGLSLVRAFINAHGGRAEVQSTPGQGSTFIVHLPTSPHAGQQPVSPPVPEPVRG
jgi:signal transduction histidine kinase